MADQITMAIEPKLAAAGGKPVIRLENVFKTYDLGEIQVHALRGVTRIHLAGGETQPVHFKLDARDLSGVDGNGDRFVMAGSYRVSVGGGQPGSGAPQAAADFAISGEQRLPE